MSRRTKVIVGYTILMLIVSGTLNLIAGQDEWFGKAVSTTITFAFGVYLGYDEGMKH